MRRSFVRSALCLALAAAPLAASAAIDATITQAQQLLRQKQAQAAYDLLAPLEDERAGDPDYDYVYGLAALESGKPGVAAFAFERCLAVDPRNGPCRVLMARTHIAMGEHKSARQELETVQGAQPPAEVQELVARYLGVVRQQETGEKRRIGAYAQLGLGYDSNVTSTTADTQIAIPVFGGTPFTLAGLSTKQEDLFLQAEGGATLEYVLDPSWTLLADASLSMRRHDDVDLFDNTVGNAGFGAAWRQGANTVMAKLQAQDYRLDDDSFRSVYGVTGQYQHAFPEDAVMSAYTQASRIDYHFGPDADRYTLGAGYSRALKADLDPVVYAGLYVGQESSEGQDFLSQDFYGLRLGGSLGLSEKLRLTGSLAVEQRKFDGQDPIFLDTREDTAVDVGLGALYRLTPRVGLRPSYTYVNSDSNIVLADYDRHVVSLDVRYEM